MGRKTKQAKRNNASSKKKKTKSKSKSKSNQSLSSKPSLIREIVNESIAGFTDSVFTQFCVSICWNLFTEYDSMQNYFHSPMHMYWICYFIHVNILDSIIWGQTYRNSVLYIYDKLHVQSIFRTLTIIFFQYFSVFSGLWASVQFVKFFFDNTTALQLQHSFIGTYEYPLNLSQNQLYTFVWQSILFQIIDRIINGLIVTFRPLLKEKTMIFDGSWMQVTCRCILFHFLIVNNRVGVINNPNYSFYANLFYWRWSVYDWTILTIPYFCIIVFNVLFSNLSILHNPTYFIKVSVASSKKKN